MKKLLFISFIFAGALLSGCANSNTQVANERVSTSPIAFEATEFDFGIIKQSGGIVSHDFAFTYIGDTPLKITGTPGSCLCTTGSINVDTLEKGTKGILTVEFNPNLHAEPEGRFFKTVAILTDPPLPVTPEVKIWTEIDLDLGEEAFELQAPHDDDHEATAESHNDSTSSISPQAVLSSQKVRNEFTIIAKEVLSQLDEGLEYEYWTFDGTVPGTFLRVKEGEEVTIHFKNDEHSKNVHSIDLHAVNGPGGGADVTQVYPGQEKSFTFTALNPGIYVYHCATPEVPEHVANGMYGLILVEPKAGLAKVDKEFYLMQGEIYSLAKRGSNGTTRLSGEKMFDENPEYIVFNGKKDALVQGTALKARVGDNIRMYVGNGGVTKVSNFHVIGEIFDTVYPEGGTPVQHNIQTTVIPAGGATIVEFTVDVPGTYKLVDHALARVPKGAYAELIVSGEQQPKIFRSLNLSNQ